MGVWIPALLAAEVHFAEQLEPARITDLIRRERISVLIAVPRVLHLLRLHLLARFPTLADQLAAPIGIKPGLSILKRWSRFRRVHRALGWKFWAVISGGATLPAELETFWNRLGFALIQGYGMTETAALVTLNHPFHVAPGTIGKPLPGREVKINDDGEILVRGDVLAGATWQHGAMHQCAGEWLATGDLAERNDHGELRFLGRKGDLIVTSAGLNIHPADLESALAAQPAIRAAVVVPCDLASGPEPVAVVLTRASDAELDAAVSAANHILADFQQIRRTLRWPELQFPYTSTGKLIRRQVAQWACNTLAGRHDSGVSAAGEDALLSLIVEVTGEPVPTTVDPNLLRLSEDLHLDSLGRVQLQSALELRFGLELEDDATASIETLADLRALVAHQLHGPDRLQPGISAELPAIGSELATSAPQPAAGKRGASGKSTVSSQPAAEQHSYPHWPWTWPVLALRIAFLELAMRPLIWLLAAPRVIRTIRKIPAGPLLIIANHVTLYDGAFVIYALPFKLRRRIAAAMSGEMLLDFRHARKQPNAFANLLAPAAYWLITALFNVFPLPNGRGFRRSFAHAGEAMDHGYSILIFPEGTRSPTGRMGHFRPGIGLLAQQSAAPILPVAILGWGEIQAAHARRFRSGRIEVRVGEPILAATEPSDPAALAAALEQSLRSLIA
jgi:long-chain acyl-CoA synthetase